MDPGQAKLARVGLAHSRAKSVLTQVKPRWPRPKSCRVNPGPSRAEWASASSQHWAHAKVESSQLGPKSLQAHVESSQLRPMSS